MIDSDGKRNAGVARHVPGLVPALLFVTLLLSSAILGFTVGVAARRPSVVTHVLVGLMVVSVFIVLKLDRPRRGLIQVNHISLLELQSALNDSLR
jgi:uncharacterized membrane protein (Fun14 family)